MNRKHIILSGTKQAWRDRMDYTLLYEIQKKSNSEKQSWMVVTQSRGTGVASQRENTGDTQATHRWHTGTVRRGEFWVLLQQGDNNQSKGENFKCPHLKELVFEVIDIVILIKSYNNMHTKLLLVCCKYIKLLFIK